MVDIPWDKAGDTMKLMWKKDDITGYVTKVEWSGSAKQAARSVSFSVAYSPDDKNVTILGIETGDEITFYPGYPDDEKTAFSGIVTERERKSEAGELSYTATDGMMHLLRSSGTYKFKNKTPEKIASMLAKDVKIPVGNLAKTKINISKIFFSQRTYYEMIMAVYTKAHQKNKKVYIAQMNGKKLDVIEKGKIISDFMLIQGEYIIDSSYSENLDSMVNRVYIYNSDNKKIGSVSNADWISKYGVFQNAISVDSGSGKTEAKNELSGVEKSANLNAIGDIRCVSGKGIMILDSRSGLIGIFWIENDTHTWENGAYTMSLELAFQNIMDEQYEDEENSSSGSSTSSKNSSALNSVLNQARSWIGISGSTNEATQYYGWNGVYWCCIFVWACFNKAGYGNLFMGGGKTASCSEVVQWYQARGKTGKVPRVGALVVYGPGGGSHIGIVEEVHGTGLHDFTSIEGNISNQCGRFKGGGRSDVYCFLYPDYPEEETSNASSGTTITGKTVNVPESVQQTGIIAENTNYSHFYSRWNSDSEQRKVADKWNEEGKPSKNGIATVGGYYCVAVRPQFGSVGDVISVVLEDGTRINCIIADEKGDDAEEWGHNQGGKISIVEWESIGNSSTNNGQQLNVNQWKGKKVTAIINGGRYSGL